MCGIAGWYVKPGSSWRPSYDLVWKLLDAIEIRGRDATGYSTLNDTDGKIFLIKGPIMARPFMDKLKEFNAPVGRIGLIHARAYTVGSPDDNSNNHPIAYDSDDCAAVIVHNGTIGNLKASYEALGIQPPAEVDSALIAPVMARFGAVEGMKFLEQHSCGAAAFASMWNDGRLLLARDGRPVLIGIISEEGEDVALVWTSANYGFGSLFNYRTSFGIEMSRLLEMKDNHYLYFPAGADRAEKGDFRLKGMYNPPPTKQSYQYQGSSTGGGSSASSFPGSNSGRNHGRTSGKQGKKLRNWERTFEGNVVRTNFNAAEYTADKPGTRTESSGVPSATSYSGELRRDNKSGTFSVENDLTLARTYGSNGHKGICFWQSCHKANIGCVATDFGLAPVCRRHHNAFVKRHQPFQMSGENERGKKLDKLRRGIRV